MQVFVETGRVRVFACAVDWPGWARSGKTEELALATLADYAPRYAPVAAAAGLRLPVRGTPKVVERIAGSGTTDFGAPGHVPALDRRATSAAQAARLADLVVASWAALDGIAASAPAALRKGPRGGGRDRDAVVQHVVDAERSYARSIGVRHREMAFDDVAAVAAMRADIERALRTPGRARAPEDKGWPARYAARRIAWHVLDHAWEIEDKST